MNEKCPKCGVAGQREETPDGRACYLVPEGDDKLLTHYPDGEDCLRRQLAAAQVIVDRLDWWMQNLAYKAPEQMFGQVQLMVAELHPEARKAPK